MRFRLGRSQLLSLGALALLFILVGLAGRFLNPYWMRILNVGAVFSILAVSLNLVYGITGQFSLGHAGFMAIGAYVSALCTLTAVEKDANFFILPIVEPLRNLTLPFLPALFLGGLAAGIAGFLIGLPVLRLRGDYLGMATLGFAEIVRVVINNLQTITNGSLGLKGLPAYTTPWWAFGAAAVSIWLMNRLVGTSYGRAFKAIRENEIAAEVIGVSLAYHKTLSFTISVDPKMFMSIMTFQIVMIVVIGGLGSISGSVVAAFLYSIALEWFRFLEAPMQVGPLRIPGIPGMRMVIFSLVLLLVILRYRRGMFGTGELTWAGMSKLLRRFRFRPAGGEAG